MTRGDREDGSEAALLLTVASTTATAPINAGRLNVEVSPDGALRMLEDANPGGLFRVTPK